jgi:hypothetical protein
MTSLSAVLKAQALAAAIGDITGTHPVITDTGAVERITFTPADQIKVREWLESMLASAQVPGDVQVDFVPVILPLAVKKLLPAVVAIALVGFLLGRL